MDIGGIGVNAPMFLKPPEKDPAMELATLTAAARKGKSDPAKPAEPQARFSTKSPAQIDTASMIALQSGEETTGSKAADEFLAFMKKTPEERLRDQILKSLNITEDDLAKMSPEERAGVEEKIKDIIKQKLTPDGEAQSGDAADSKTADMLKLLG
jgi:hypothetical protein